MVCRQLLPAHVRGAGDARRIDGVVEHEAATESVAGCHSVGHGPRV